MRTFASFIANNAGAAGPGARPGARPGDPGARITAQVLQSDLIRAGAADRLVRIDR